MSAGRDERFRVEIDPSLDVPVVVFDGELVVADIGEVRRVMESTLEGARSIVVDLSRLTYVDTPGLALFVRLAGRCRDAGGALALAGLPAAFVSLAESLRLDEAMILAGNVDSALERLAG